MVRDDALDGAHLHLHAMLRAACISVGQRNRGLPAATDVVAGVVNELDCRPDPLLLHEGLEAHSCRDLQETAAICFPNRCTVLMVEAAVRRLQHVRAVEKPRMTEHKKVGFLSAEVSSMCDFHRFSAATQHIIYEAGSC